MTQGILEKRLSCELKLSTSRVKIESQIHIHIIHVSHFFLLFFCKRSEAGLNILLFVGWKEQHKHYDEHNIPKNEKNEKMRRKKEDSHISHLIFIITMWIVAVVVAVTHMKYFVRKKRDEMSEKIIWFSHALLAADCCWAVELLLTLPFLCHIVEHNENEQII